MRRIVLASAVALFAVPAAASHGDKRPPGDGCLVVRNGRGVVSVAAKGTVFGRFDQGQVRIEDPVEGDGTAPKVYGAQRVRLLSDTKTLYIGTDVRFRVGGLFRIRVAAVGINLSAVGRGSVVLTSDDFLEPGEYSADTASFCQEGFQPMPDLSAKLVLGSPG